MVPPNAVSEPASLSFIRYCPSVSSFLSLVRYLLRKLLQSKNLRVAKHLENQGIEGRTTLTFILMTQCVRVQTGFSWMCAHPVADYCQSGNAKRRELAFRLRHRQTATWLVQRSCQVMVWMWLHFPVELFTGFVLVSSQRLPQRCACVCRNTAIALCLRLHKHCHSITHVRF